MLFLPLQCCYSIIYQLHKCEGWYDVVNFCCACKEIRVRYAVFILLIWLHEQLELTKANNHRQQYQNPLWKSIQAVDILVEIPTTLHTQMVTSRNPNYFQHNYKTKKQNWNGKLWLTSDISFPSARKINLCLDNLNQLGNLCSSLFDMKRQELSFYYQNYYLVYD